jgi:hypothetical protein
MNKTIFILVAFFGFGRAEAQCRLPPNPAVFCGLGATAVRANVVPIEDLDPPPLGVHRIVVTSVAGEPIEGVASGTRIELRPDGSDLDAVLPPSAGSAIFILEDADTFVIGAAVNEDERVLIDSFGKHSVPVDYLLTMAVDPDPERCADVAFEVVEPQVNRFGSGHCDDQVGCAASGFDHGLSLLSLAVLFRHRRRLTSCGTC